MVEDHVEKMKRRVDTLKIDEREVAEAVVDSVRQLLLEKVGDGRLTDMAPVIKGMSVGYAMLIDLIMRQIQQSVAPVEFPERMASFMEFLGRHQEAMNEMIVKRATEMVHRSRD